jgi:carboxyl-terminal processing protease
MAYFPIEFKGANAKGFGDYPDGFIPGGNVSLPTALPGCVVADDLNKDLGDTSEGMLAAALNYRNTGTCPTVTASRIEKAQGLPLASALSRLTLKNPLRENRILLPNR